MYAIDLADLDNAPRLDLDSTLWPRNLAALHAEDPHLAGQLENVTLPPHWRPVAGLDDFPTYRIEPDGQPPQWLAGTAAPRARADGLLRYGQIADKNPALPTIAAGAELKSLLDRLAQQQAVFVFEKDTLRLAAVLHTLDLARAITAGRCILVPTGREQPFLEQMLEQHPGLLPPGTIVTLPNVTDERLAHLRTVCETAARRINDARSQRLHDLTRRFTVAQPVASGSHSPRLAVLALGPRRQSHSLCAELAAAAGKLNWKSCHRAAIGPRNVHPLPHCEHLADFGADLAICIEHGPELLPLPAGKLVCQWHLHARDVPENLPDNETFHLAASPRIADCLRSAGVPAARVLDFHWAIPESAASQPPPAPSDSLPPTVVIVADLPDASPSKCRIEQPTHKKLWQHLRQIAEKEWQTARISQPTALLRNAERASGVEVGETSLRNQFVRIIEHVLIPAVILERILQRLQQAAAEVDAGRPPFEVVCVGTGWHRCSSESRPLTAASSMDHLFEPHATDPAAAPPKNRAPVLAAVFAGPLDPLAPTLFQAAALGWPLLIHNPSCESLTARLGGILHPKQHYDQFAGARDLLAALNAIRANPKEAHRRADRLRTHLQQHHTLRHRLTALSRHLAVDRPETVA